MRTAIEQFRANIERVRNLGSLTKILDSQTTQVLDVSDILRAELVLAVSLLDHYIHEIVRIGMLDAYKGDHPRTPAFLGFGITINSVLQAIPNSEGEAWLEQEIRNRHGHMSFQNSEKIADAIRLISEAHLWNEVAAHIGSTGADVRQRLDVIVNRRNQIAHEADMNPSYPQMRWPIDEQLVDGAIGFIEQIAEAIYLIVS